MVIDPAIVVLENIHRHYGEAGEIESRESLRRLILRSVGEVAVPVAASTLTDGPGFSSYYLHRPAYQRHTRRSGGDGNLRAGTCAHSLADTDSDCR